MVFYTMRRGRAEERKGEGGGGYNKETSIKKHKKTKNR